MPQPLIPHWYIPSFYGDVRLEARGRAQCRVIAEKTTERERGALQALAEVASKRRWLPTSKDPAPLYSDVGVLKTTLEAPIETVAKQLAKLLKLHRKIISAVQYKDGKIEEVFEDGEVPDAAAGGDGGQAVAGCNSEIVKINIPAGGFG